MKAVRLRCEYLKDPIGIDIVHPRLMWNCEGGSRQSARRIVAERDGRQIWDSGKIPTESMHADLPTTLSSRMRIVWKVKLWDETDTEGEWSENTVLETGLLSESDWSAVWIAGDYRPRREHRYPVDCFEKTFCCDDVCRARLYITACGLYTAALNGERIGRAVFAPGSTDYRRRIRYQTYDVTHLLKSGENTLTVQLADGWYRGSNGAKGRTNTYGKQTKLLAQLEWTDKSGAAHTVASDGSWRWSCDGPIRFADLKDGEIVDARLTPSYGGKAAVVRYRAALSASDHQPVTEHERFSPCAVTVTPKGRTLLEFPQNLSGYVSFSVSAHEGQTIRVTLGELTDENGELTLQNIQCVRKGKKTPLQTILYTCKEGKNTYTSSFFYGGFRYAEVETDVPFEKDDFAAVAVYSDFEETAVFSCSHPLISRFVDCTRWSLKSNSTDFPSDCPTRERMGWTGDSQVFFGTASYLTDYAAFARKHLCDIYDRQWKSGRLPQIAPYANEDWFMWVMNGSVGWACAGVYIPLYFYRKYGDDRLLAQYYEGMLRYAGFMIRRAGKWGGIYAKPLRISRKSRRYAVNCGQSYGEWAEPNDVFAFHWYDFATPHPEESTAYTYFTLKRVLEVARILGKENDKRLERIREYSEGARRAYRELVTTPGFSLDTDRQAKLVRPLFMSLLDEEQTAYAKQRLILAMEHYGWRLGTGFLSTPMILSVLADIDISYAYRLLENEKMPGWLFMPKSGSTTVWESWEGNATPDHGIASLNHYSKGAICEWIFSVMCGISITGENRFTIAPRPGGSITQASLSYRSVYGKVACAWEKTGGRTVYTVTVPSNTTAHFSVPGREETLAAGSYRFEV